MDYVNLAYEYKDVAFDFLFALHALALVVVNVTKTPSDDAFLKQAYGALEFLAGIVSRKAKT